MPTILIVDDSELDRRIIAKTLSQATSLQPIFCADGREALKHLELQHPDLILTDMMMPNMDGLELVTAIVNQHPSIPVILITGKGSEDLAVQALKLGAASYVSKTKLQESLLETVHTVLEIAEYEATGQQFLRCLQSNDCLFSLENNPAFIPPLVHFFQQCMKTLGTYSESTIIRVSIALEEAVNNAMVHGNLEISSAERDNPDHSFSQLIASKAQESPFRERQVRVRGIINREESVFEVSDQGNGFDVGSLPDPTSPENLERESGRGLLLIQTFMDEINFSDSGNHVRMIKQADVDA